MRHPMPDKLSDPSLVLRFKDIQRLLSLSRGAIYSSLADGDFPRPFKLGPRAIGWLRSEIDAWLKSRTRQSGNGAVAQ